MLLGLKQACERIVELGNTPPTLMYSICLHLSSCMTLAIRKEVQMCRINKITYNVSYIKFIIIELKMASTSKMATILIHSAALVTYITARASQTPIFNKCGRPGGVNGYPDKAGHRGGSEGSKIPDVFYGRPLLLICICH